MEVGMAGRKAATAVATTQRRPKRIELVEHRNEVVMVGRLAAAAVPRALPSGDEVVSWRLVVERPAGSTPSSDTVNCSAFGARVRGQALNWDPGDVIEVSGALHRRFWRGPAGLQNRYEVDVVKASRRKP
jgi:single-strand DNA-binding protein